MQKPWIADVCSKCSSGGCVHGRGHGSASVEHSLPAFSQTRELSADKCKTCDSDYMSSIKQWYLCASSKDMIRVEDSSEVIASYLPVCVSALAWCAHCLCLQSTRERTSNLCMTYVWWRIRWQELGSVFWALKTVPTYCAVIGILFPDDWYNYRCDDRYWSSNLVMTWHSDKKMFLTVHCTSRKVLSWWPCSQLEFAESGRKEIVREAWIRVPRTKNLMHWWRIQWPKLFWCPDLDWVCRAWKELLRATWIGRWRRSLPLKQVGVVWSVQVTFVSVGESD